MSEMEKLLITRGEYAALNEVRGFQEDAHYMVVLAKRDEKGRYVLEGAPETFRSLSSDLFEEIYCQLSPASRRRHLAKLYDRLNPDCGEL